MNRAGDDQLREGSGDARPCRPLRPMMALVGSAVRSLTYTTPSRRNLRATVAALGTYRLPVECYLCGRTLDAAAPDEADRPTRDHVPPRTLLPPARPSDLITLPCCRSCQAAYSPDEEYFRNNLAPLAPASRSEGARELWQRAKRGIKRREALTHDFVARLGWVVADGKDGSVRRLAVSFDIERTNRVLRKIARGLLYHHMGTRDPVHDQALVRFNPPGTPELQRLVNLAQYRRRFGGAFAYTGGFAVDRPNQSLWVLWFYDQVGVVAFGGDAGE